MQPDEPSPIEERPAETSPPPAIRVPDSPSSSLPPTAATEVAPALQAPEQVIELPRSCAELTSAAPHTHDLGAPAQPSVEPVFGVGVPQASVSPAASIQPASALPPPPLAPIVHEVEAVPMSAAEPRARTIEAPPPAPVGASTPAAATSPSQPFVGSTTSATGAGAPLGGVSATASAPPHTGAVPPTSAPPIAPPPAAPRPPSPWQRRRRFLWAILCHLMMILVIPTVFVGMAITFLIWQIKGKHDRLVEDQGREALNFQINVAGLAALLGITCLAAPLIPLVYFISVVMAIIAARHASDGEVYRYPWVLRIVTH